MIILHEVRAMSRRLAVGGLILVVREVVACMALQGDTGVARIAEVAWMPDQDIGTNQISIDDFD
jgi:hypothetical protein